MVNREELGSLPEFEMNDGGLRFQKNITLKTSSMEVIVNFLAEKGIVADDSLYIKKS